MDAEDPVRPSRTALVMKGGGVKGLAFAGALGVLEQHFRLGPFVGTSAGAIAAVLLAAGYQIGEVREILVQKDFRDFLDRGFSNRLRCLVFQRALNSGDPIQQWIRDLLARKIEREAAIRMCDLPTRAVIYASSERDGTVVFDSEGENRTAPVDFAVRCSMSIPYVFGPCFHQGAEVYDGGLLNNFPLEKFRDDNPGQSVLGLYLSAGPAAFSPRGLRIVRVVNVLLGRDERATVDKNREQIVVIDPSPVRTTDFGLTDLDKRLLLATGKAAALSYLAEHKIGAVEPRTLVTSATEAAELRSASRRARSTRSRLRVAAAAGLFAIALLLVPGLRSSAGSVVGPVAAAALSFLGVGGVPQESAQPVVPLLNVDQLTDEALRSLLGQMFMIGYEENQATPDPGPVARQLLQRYKVGGLLLFQRNVPVVRREAETRRAFAGLTDALSTVAAGQSKLPLLIAVDQEGGSTQALGGELVTQVPAAMAIGGLRMESEAEKTAYLVGQELTLLGLNTNLAPVADVNTNSDNDLIRDRSFGGHQQLVTPMVAAWHKGARAAGVQSVAKHFPGHGSTREGIETGKGIPLSSLSIASFGDALLPFRELVRGGIPAVMTSHFNPAAVSGGQTVTFDDRMIRLLRAKEPVVFAGGSIDGLGFSGVIITDDLDMPALTARPGQEHLQVLIDSVTRAFMAGHDILMLGNVFPDRSSVRARMNSTGQFKKGLTISEFGQIYDAFEKFIFDEPSERERRRKIEAVRAALRRIVGWKSTFGRMEDSVQVRLDLLEKVRQEHAQQASRLFASTFSVIQSNEGFPSFDLSTGSSMLLVFGTEFRPESLQSLGRGSEYAKKVRENLKAWHVPRELADRFERRGVTIRAEMEAQYPRPDDYDARSLELRRIVESQLPTLSVFVLNNVNQAEQFAHIVAKLATVPGFNLKSVVAIITAHPNLLSRYAQSPQVSDLSSRLSYVFAYTGARDRAAEELADALAKLPPGAAPGEAGRPPMVINDLNPSPEWTLRTMNTKR